MHGWNCHEEAHDAIAQIKGNVLHLAMEAPNEKYASGVLVDVGMS